MTAEMPYIDLANRLGQRIEGAAIDRGEMSVPCPIDNATVSIIVQASEGADAIVCSGGCDPDDVEDALRTLARALPRVCGDPARTGRDAYDHRRTCPRCLNYEKAARTAFGEVGERFRGSRSDEEDNDWAPVALADAPVLPAPSILKVGNEHLLRPAQIVLVHGARASGKTPVSYIAVVEQVKAGNLALIVDYEMGQPGARDLLRELGLSDVEMREGVYFVDNPGAMVGSKRKRLLEEIRQREEATGRVLTLAVIDSLTESMAATVPGSSDNDAQDVMVWFNSLPKALVRDFEVAVIVIDHSGVNDGPRPSGSHKKQEVPWFHLWVEAVHPFSRQNEDGMSRLVVQKDRTGVHVRGETVGVVRSRLGGSFYLTPKMVATTSGTTVTIPGGMIPANGTDNDVLADLRAAGAAGLARTAITGTGAAGKYRRAALDRLIASGQVMEAKVGKFMMCTITPPMSSVSVSP